MGFSDSERKDEKILRVIVLGALGIRLLLMAHFKSYVIDNDWAFGYEAGRIAKAIAMGEGFSSPFQHFSGATAWLAPVYPYFLAFVFKIFGLYTTDAAIGVLTINCLASALTCIPIYHIGRATFGRDVGHIAAAAFALYPPSIWHAINTIWDTTVFTLLVTVLISWLVVLGQRIDFKSAAFYGFFMGFVTLVNPVVITFYPFALTWLFLQHTSQKGKERKYIATVIVMAAITVTPWLLRNYAVFGRFMLRSNFGLELKLANNWETSNALELTDGGHIPTGKVWKRGHPSVNAEEFRLYASLGELNYVDRQYNEAVAFVWGNPKKFLWLTLRRIYYFWLGDLGGRNDWAGNLDISRPISGMKKLCYVLPLPFMVAGVFLAIKRNIKISPLVAFILLLPAVYYITHVAHRYRFPIEPTLLIFASYGFYSLIRRMKKGFFLGTDRPRSSSTSPSSRGQVMYL